MPKLRFFNYLFTFSNFVKAKNVNKLLNVVECLVLSSSRLVNNTIGVDLLVSAENKFFSQQFYSKIFLSKKKNNTINDYNLPYKSAEVILGLKPYE